MVLQCNGVNGGGSKSQTGVLGRKSVGVFGVAPVGVEAVAVGEPEFAFLILASCTLSHFSMMLSSLVHSHGKSLLKSPSRSAEYFPDQVKNVCALVSCLTKCCT